MSKKNSNSPLIVAVLASAVVTASLSYFAASSTLSISDKEFEERSFEAIDKYIAQLESGEREAGDATAKAQYDPVEAADDDPYLGEDDAPVLIVEFSDYQCPYCKRFYTDTLSKIKENYVDTGKVKFVYRDFTLSSHPAALPAANFAECVRAQTDDETYFKVHDQIFDTLALRFDYEEMADFASQFDLDLEELQSCHDEQKFENEIIADRDYAVEMGITGTPGFLINGKKVSGAVPYQNFQSIIEGEL